MNTFYICLCLILSIQRAYCLDQNTIDSLNRSGYQVIMGELTGAGSKLSIQRLAGFILNDGILLKEKCKSIVIKSNSNTDISNIVRVVFENQNIEASDFEGIIVKK